MNVKLLEICIVQDARLPDIREQLDGASADGRVFDAEDKPLRVEVAEMRQTALQIVNGGLRREGAQVSEFSGSAAILLYSPPTYPALYRGPDRSRQSRIAAVWTPARLSTVPEAVMPACHQMRPLLQRLLRFLRLQAQH